ncbi:hypothetical protein [Pseudanabaena sp. ABRG5-3]|uniref:hypothetical protein n=1 Tax=Pseudanabaena sp. ABRG5-3 TaxID=685565 RepID=UPI000F82C540|nr:hypothetical protein [Pseudanabaena sp. ABRG5-3]
MKIIWKYLGAVKYKIPKPVAHAQRAPQVLALVFNMLTALCAYLKPRKIFESGAKRRFQKFFCTT